MLQNNVKRCRTLLWELNNSFSVINRNRGESDNDNRTQMLRKCMPSKIFLSLYYGLGILKILFVDDNHELNIDEFLKNDNNEDPIIYM